MIQITLHRAVPTNNAVETVTVDYDYALAADGVSILGYGTAPAAEDVVLGISTFDTSQLEGVKHRVVKTEQRICDCKILMSTPNTVMYRKDYDVKLKKFKGEKEIKIKQLVPHYTVFPVHNVASVNEWFNIMFGTEAGVSCQWMPCTMVADAEDVDLDGGSEDGDLTGVACIPVRAAYLISRATFPLCNSLHDRIFLNGLMTLITSRDMVKPPQYMPVYMYIYIYHTTSSNQSRDQIRLVSRPTLSVLKHYHVVQGSFPNISYSQIIANLKCNYSQLYSGLL